jgi:hypothetical protein
MKLCIQADNKQLEWLLQPDTDPRTGKPRAGFETVEQCRNEDLLRADGVRTAAQAVSSAKSGEAHGRASELDRFNLDSRAALNLADRLEAGAESGIPPKTLASALFMREQRLRFGGALLELVNHSPATKFG